MNSWTGQEPVRPLSDATEVVRRSMVPLMHDRLADWRRDGGRTWSPAAMAEEFEVIGFMAPMVVVKRKRDGVKGSLEFTHSPRVYFHWKADSVI